MTLEIGIILTIEIAKPIWAVCITRIWKRSCCFHNKNFYQRKTNPKSKTIEAIQEWVNKEKKKEVESEDYEEDNKNNEDTNINNNIIDNSNNSSSNSES